MQTIVQISWSEVQYLYNYSYIIGTTAGLAQLALSGFADPHHAVPWWPNVANSLPRQELYTILFYSIPFYFILLCYIILFFSIDLQIIIYNDL